MAFDLESHLARLDSLARKTPFALRITEWKDKPVPVLVIKERRQSEGGEDGRPRLVELGHLAGEPQRRLLPVLRRIVEPVTDANGVPLEVQRYLTTRGLRLRGNLPLDEEAGAKLALIFRLQERLQDLDRVELIARRVARFTREEAAYWLSRTTHFGPAANRWALAGLRILLGGQPGDAEIGRMLEALRLRG